MKRILIHEGQEYKEPCTRRLAAWTTALFGCCIGRHIAWHRLVITFGVIPSEIVSRCWLGMSFHDVNVLE
jgi:hypothetical protein